MAPRIGPKTRRYLAQRKQGLPVLSVPFEQTAMEIAVSGLVREIMDGVVPSERERLTQHIMGLRKELETRFETEFRASIERHLGQIPALVGLPGEPGEPGLPGEPGEPGAAGYTPIAGKDYPTADEIEAFIAMAVQTASASLETKLNEALMAELAKPGTPKELGHDDFVKIARGLESLRGAEELSYTALKDTPDLTEGKQRHTLHRGGGGKQTYTYDLSGLCDGVTKSFAVPPNSRILQVVGTDSPAGAYRKDVDWIGSGTTTLELTSEVAAPTEGATLYILYVQ